MTAVDVKKQVKTIKAATRAASKSKASALKFLTDAGIFKFIANTKTAKVTNK